MDLPWFKLKKYPHIGLPITIKDRDWVVRYVKNQNRVATHSFLPLLHKTIIKRKFRADEVNPHKNPSGKRKRIQGNPKVRDIYYAAHLDGLIFSYYSYLLQQQYETIVTNSNFNKSIVAYRKIPVVEGSTKNKCNIEFAKEAFEFILKNQDKKLSVMVADVTKFFDTLNHKILKRQWSTVLGLNTLPKDHYNVFKALTRWQYIEEHKLFEAQKEGIIVERAKPNNSKAKQRKKVAIKKKRFFREKGAIAYCEKKEFLSDNLNLVQKSHTKNGIPQGSAISATLANIYMLDFDQSVYDEINKINGYYQRYSDDMIIICERRYQSDILKFIRNQIENLKLEIHPSKTTVYHFEKIDNVFTGFQVSEDLSEVNYNQTLEYLGFSFNGQQVLVKSAGFSKYYRSMKRSFKKSTSLALNGKNPDKRIFKSRLYKRFTHRGSQRKLVHRPSRTDSRKYVPTKKYDWGNYLSYVYKANASMKSLNGNNAIKKQSRRFWYKFHVLMEHHQERVDSRFKNKAD